MTVATGWICSKTNARAMISVNAHVMISATVDARTATIHVDARTNATVDAKKRNPGSVISGVGATGAGLPDL